MKVYGQLEKAQIENVTADPTGAELVPGRSWYRTDLKLYRVYDGAAVQEFADLLSAQTLVNKTLTAPVMSNPDIDGATTYDEIATPTNPAASEHKIYFKSDGKAYTLDSSGSEQPLGSGSGSGGINYVPDGSSNIESTIGDWEDDDGAGSPSSSLSAAVTTTVGEVLIDSASLKFSKTAANASGHFFKLDTKTIDPAVRGQRLYFSFYWNPISGYVNDDLVFEAYDITNAAVLYSGTAEDIQLLNLAGKNLFFADLEDTTAQVELRLKVNNTNTNAFTASGDLFEFKVDTPIPGLKESTFSASFINNGTASIDRDDNNIIASINRSSAGSGTVTFASGKFTVAPIVVGNLKAGADGSTMRKLHIFSVSTSGFSWISNEDLSNTRAYYDADFEIVVKAQGADAKQAIVSTTENMFKNTIVAAYNANSPSIASAAATEIVDDWTTEIDNSNAFNASTGVFTAPAAGKYYISAQIAFNNNTAGIRAVAIRKNGTDVAAKDFLPTATVSHSLEVDKILDLAKDDTIDVRAYQSSGGALTLRGLAPYNTLEIQSIKDTSAFSVFGETEYREVAPTTTQVTTLADTWIDVEASPSLLTLGPGTWQIGYEASLLLFRTGGAFFAVGNMAIYDSSNNQLSNSVTLSGQYLDATFNAHYGSVSKLLTVTISADTSYKLRMRAGSPGANLNVSVAIPGSTGSLTDPDATPTLFARRIK